MVASTVMLNIVVIDRDIDGDQNNPYGTPPWKLDATYRLNPSSLPTILGLHSHCQVYIRRSQPLDISLITWSWTDVKPGVTPRRGFYQDSLYTEERVTPKVHIR